MKANGAFIFEPDGSESEISFAEMLMREFPSNNLRVETSSLLPRKCGISEGDKIKKIQLIQRQVKHWLIRRQKQDVLRVTEFLNQSINASFERQRSEIQKKRAAITIQRTVRNWLTKLQHSDNSNEEQDNKTNKADIPLDIQSC